MPRTVPDRPSDRRAAARHSVVWSGLEPVLSHGRCTVLDVGGGTGELAVRVALAGHDVSVVDPNPDALAALARRAAECGVDVAGKQGDLDRLTQHVAPSSVDLLLCHGVLEMVEDPARALARAVEVLRPGGVLSLVVSQRHAAVVARALAGHFVRARELLDPDATVSPRAGRRFTHDEVTRLLTEAGTVVERIDGIQVFSDLVPGALVDIEPGAAAALAELERAVAGLPEYRSLASRLHLLARR